MKRRWQTILSLLATALAISGWSESTVYGQQAAAPNKAEAAAGQRVVLTIGEEKITAAEIGELIQTLPPRYQAFYGGPGKHLLPQYIIALKVLSAEAVRLKLAEQPLVVRASRALARAFLPTPPENTTCKVLWSANRSFRIFTRRTRHYLKMFALATFSSARRTPR